MTTLLVSRVLTLPLVLAASTMYIVQASDADHAEVHFSNNDGSAARRLINEADVLALISDNTSPTADALTTARVIEITGDASWQVTFDGSADVDAVLTLANSGVTAGEYPVVTVDAKGRVTSGRVLAAADIPLIPGSKITSDISVNTTGNAATSDLADEALVAEALKTARSINGVAFDGTADIVITAEDSVPRIAESEKGQADGVATLDGAGKVPASQLPSFVDDVLEFDALADFPATGESGKIYVAADTGLVYRWTGSQYIAIPSGVGLADAALKLQTARAIALSGDATGTVNFDGSANVTIVTTLAASGVTAGEYPVVTVDAKGRVTAGRALDAADIPTLDFNKVTSAAGVELVAAEW